MLPIVYHPDYQAPLRPGHRFPMSKYGYLRQALESRGLLPLGKFFAPRAFTAPQIELAHARSYVDRVLTLTLSPAEVRQIGLPATERVVRRSTLSVAGTTLAAWLALEHGIACNAAGGSHHAGPDHGSGFCVFNDVAVAIRNLSAQGVRGPFLVIDADVHQGDGTARIFASDPDVVTFSIHAAKNFPLQKSESTIDITLQDGVGGQAYLDVFEHALMELLERVHPRLAFYNAGVDVHAEDRLGRLALDDADLRARDRMVLSALRQRSIAVVGVLGGGYHPDPTRLAGLHAIMFEEAASFV
ncbi:MAG: histone deacetylase [Paracoccaceae bacterium]